MRKELLTVCGINARHVNPHKLHTFGQKCFNTFGRQRSKVTAPHRRLRPACFNQHSARQCFAAHQRFDCSNGLRPHEFTRCRFGFQLREVNDKAGAHKPFQRQRCGVSRSRKEVRRRINVRSAVRRKTHFRNIRRIPCGNRSRQPHDKRRISRINRRANTHFGRDVDKALFHSAHSCLGKARARLMFR